MSYAFASRCIHGDKETEKPFSYGALSVPIYQTATYAHPGVGQSTGYDYTRESNPTRAELERVVSSLEGCVDTIACSNGMAALSLLFECFDSGSHFICTEDLYGGSVRLFDTVCTKRDMTFSYIDTSDLSLVEKEIKENTKAIYVETPSNPTMLVTDLAAIRKIADAHGLYVIVDNTFLSPYFQKPFDFGADFVVHSGTKFLGGHNDTLAGFLCIKDRERAKELRFTYKTIGYCLAPFDSYLILRGIKTLAVRLERQQENAGKIARWLKKQPRVKKVFYVGLEDHPGYEINKRQATGAGSMISFTVDSPERAKGILEKIQLIAYAESLGGVESLMTYPMLQTHGDVPEEVRNRLGITDAFLRMSVGIEDVDDLIADLEQAFA